MNWPFLKRLKASDEVKVEAFILTPESLKEHSLQEKKIQGLLDLVKESQFAEGERIRTGTGKVNEHVSKMIERQKPREKSKAQIQEFFNKTLIMEIDQTPAACLIFSKLDFSGKPSISLEKFYESTELRNNQKYSQVHQIVVEKAVEFTINYVLENKIKQVLTNYYTKGFFQALLEKKIKEAGVKDVVSKSGMPVFDPAYFD